MAKKDKFIEGGAVGVTKRGDSLPGMLVGSKILERGAMTPARKPSLLQTILEKIGLRKPYKPHCEPTQPEDVFKPRLGLTADELRASATELLNHPTGREAVDAVTETKFSRADRASAAEKLSKDKTEPDES